MNILANIPHTNRVRFGNETRAAFEKSMKGDKSPQAIRARQEALLDYLEANMSKVFSVVENPGGHYHGQGGGMYVSIFSLYERLLASMAGRPTTGALLEKLDALKALNELSRTDTQGDVP